MIVYRIMNLINGKIYIGQTTKPKLMTRWREHVWFSKNEKYRSWRSALQRAIRKHGFDKFTIESIYVANSRKELNAMETFFIILHQSHKPENGYNMTLGGETPLAWWTGKKRPVKTVDKMMATKRKNGTTCPIGWNQDIAIIKKRVSTRRANGDYGVHRIGTTHKPETIKKMQQRQQLRASKGEIANPVWLNSEEVKKKQGRSYSLSCAVKNGGHRKEAVKLRDEGLSFPQIARQLGVSVSTAFFCANGKVDDGKRGERLAESLSGTL